LDRIIGEVRHAVQAVGASHASAQTINSNTVVITSEDLEAHAMQLEALAKSVRDDYESVRVEAALQREVTLRLLAQSPPGAPLNTLRSLEEEIRRQVIGEKGELATNAKNSPA
jgi:hypothetical protein